MARVTVEDCVLKIPNRFDLVMLAAQRARDIASGAPLTLDRDNDKNPVVALREIADETVELEILADSLIKGLQRQVEIDEPEEETSDLELTDELADPVAELSSLTAPESGPEAEEESTDVDLAAEDEPAETVEAEADPAAEAASDPAVEAEGGPAAEVANDPAVEGEGEDETPT